MLKDWFKNLNKKKLAKEAVVGTGSVVGRIIGLALKIVVTVLLIAICSGFLFVVIFSAYVRNTMKDDLTVTLDEFSLNQTSTIYYFNKDSQQWECFWHKQFRRPLERPCDGIPCCLRLYHRPVCRGFFT